VEGWLTLTRHFDTFVDFTRHICRTPTLKPLSLNFSRDSALARRLQFLPATHEPDTRRLTYSQEKWYGGTMKRIISSILALAVVMLFAAWTQADAYAQEAGKAQGKGGMQQQQGVGMFDDDGDGIPNCDDPDYTRPKDGTGKKLGRMNQGGKGNGGNQGLGQGKGMGPRDGSGPRGQLGTCDGTGPKGKGRAAK
jgi:hypothetical protein